MGKFAVAGVAGVLAAAAIVAYGYDARGVAQLLDAVALLLCAVVIVALVRGRRG